MSSTRKYSHSYLVKWFNTLNTVPLYGPDTFYLARESVNGTYRFTSFSSPIECARWIAIEYLNGKELYYHELMTATRLRYLYFDVDVLSDASHQEAVPQFMQTLQQTLQKVTKSDTPVKMVVASASNESKLSFHIVVHDIASTFQGCRAVLDKVMDQMFQYAEWFDRGVYTKGRQMRTLLSTKRHQQRPLLPYSLEHHGVGEIPNDLDTVTYLIQSMWISVYRDDVRIIEVTQPPSLMEATISNSDADMAYTLYTSVFTQEEQCYQRGSVQGSVIQLRRIRPGPCRVCQRLHGDETGRDGKGENARLVVGRDGKVRFFCYREPNKGFLLGDIKAPDEWMEIVANQPKAYLGLDIPETELTSEELIIGLVRDFGLIIPKKSSHATID